MAQLLCSTCFMSVRHVGFTKKFIFQWQLKSATIVTCSITFIMLFSLSHSMPGYPDQSINPDQSMIMINDDQSILINQSFWNTCLFSLSSPLIILLNLLSMDLSKMLSLTESRITPYDYYTFEVTTCLV